MQHIIDRFVSYVTIDTESDPNSDTTPSTKKQFDLANKLVEELKTIGLKEVTIDKHGYIMATLPSNVDHEVPTIGFISHFDTTPDFTGKDVKPQIIPNYDGGDIVLNKEQNIILSPNYFKDLLLYKGQTLITTNGLTLLGADDKAGITEIVTAMEYLINNPHIKHGKIRVGFTPDEEIGRGADLFDVKKFGADWAYTMDGSQIGELEYENFNAAAALIKVNGKIVHPGYAKGKMINAIKLAAEFVSKLPNTNLSPETTSGREGFVHPTSVSGGLESALVQFIIRDHDTSKLKIYEDLLVELAQSIVDQYQGSKFTFAVKEQYRNMKEELVKVPFVADYAVEAMIKANVTPKRAIIRGGTDGSRLSFMGLPCPNIFTGEMAIHSRHEYVSVQDMLAAKNTLIELVQIWTNHKTKNG